MEGWKGVTGGGWAGGMGGHAGPGATVSRPLSLGLCRSEAGAAGREAEQGWPHSESHRATWLCLESDRSRARAEAGTRPEATALVQA